MIRKLQVIRHKFQCVLSIAQSQLINYDLQLRLLLFDHPLEIGFEGGGGGIVPKGQAAQLVVVIPVEIEFVDELLACLVFFQLRIVEVEGRDAADEKGLHIGGIAAAGDSVGALGYIELLLLVAETLHQDEQVLVEIHGFLPHATFNNLAVAFCHFHASTAFAPVEQRDFYAYFNHLVVAQTVVGLRKTVGSAGVALSLIHI